MTQGVNFVKNNKVWAHSYIPLLIAGNFASTRKNIFMNKLFATICLLTFHYGSQAQYYYKDIVTNKLLTADMQAYKQKKIHKIILNSYEDDGSPSDGFLCEKTISRDYRTSELFTRSNISAISLFTSEFNDKLQLVSSTDSSSISATRNHYSYDASGRLTKVESSVKSNDDDFTNEIIEEHIYYYSEAGALQYMMRVKDRRDSTKILFSTDEKNVDDLLQTSNSRLQAIRGN